MKKNWLVASVLLVFTLGIQASEQKLPEHWFGEDPNSTITIDYSDWDYVLQASVLLSGPPSRELASEDRGSIGTRMKNKYNVKTINAGNKFFYERFRKTPELKATVSTIRDSLQKVPAEVQLNQLKNDEQLAYWLNLYNVVVVDEINKVYPQKKLEDFVTDDDGLLERKTVTVEGVALSLNDIQHKVLKVKFNKDPLTLYGMYQGYIGSPSIRKHAYTGDNVRRTLTANAFDFINSNRGTYPAGKEFLVANFYKRNADYFPDFKADLSAHLKEYLSGSDQYSLDNAKKMVAKIDDWTVTDIYGSNQNFGGSVADSSAALLGAFSQIGGPPETSEIANTELLSSALQSRATDYGRFSPELMLRLKELKLRNEQSRGTVTVKDLKEESEQN
ncbi:DUF547 domain-containing protein [Rheinheimera marina]|uniref:DUF547 domain-containing protein n=1 Tax=Rheinheimera marina TaxID=1774958 RepID=A0ABV9JLD2_9GAMM